MRQRQLPEDDGDDGLVVRGCAVTFSPGTVALPTAAGWNHLLYASAGVMTVEADAGTWIVPPHRALWMPAGAPHRIAMHGRVSVRSLYFHGSLDALPHEWSAVNVPPLLRELILFAVRTSPLDLARPEHERLVGVILDQLQALPQAPLQLPTPTDVGAASVAAALRADPSLSVDEAIRRSRLAAGASRRTLERRFVTETGMGIGRWRQRVRLARALELLATGKQVTEVATAVGYGTPSAFCVMFRDQLGESPSRYFRAGR